MGNLKFTHYTYTLYRGVPRIFGEGGGAEIRQRS